MGPGGMQRLDPAEEVTKETPNGIQEKNGDMEGQEEEEADQANPLPI